MRTFTQSQCESCISYDHRKCSCIEESSSLFGGNVSPLHLACDKFISMSKVYAQKNREEMVQGAHDGRYERQPGKAILSNERKQLIINN